MLFVLASPCIHITRQASSFNFGDRAFEYCLTDPVAEGSPFTITQTVDKSDVVRGVVTWKYTNAVGVTLTAITCDINNNLPHSCPSTSLYTATMATSGSTKYKVTLTGKSMSRLRDQSTWSWYGDDRDNSIGQCDLPVYSLQSDPECEENIHVSSDGKNVLWTCIVDKVYPEIDCQFQYRKGTSGNFMSVSSDRVTSNKVTTNGKYPPRSVYHHYTCVMILPISGLTGAGSYQFMFLGAVRVNVKGGVKTEFKESGPKPLTLASPQVELVDCPTPQEYIKEGVTKTCGCRIKTQGTPPGQPVWLDSNINFVGKSVSNGVNYLSIKYNSDDQKPTYYCRGISPLGSGPDVNYTPKFAYGPSQISLSFNSNDKVTDSINKCEETTSFITYCDIAMVNVNPKPTIIVTSSDGSPITPQRESTPSGFYRYTFKVVPKGGGIPTITCQATNAIFSDLTTTENKTIAVQEPPVYAPVMTATISNKKKTVENGGIITVTSGDTVQVKCRVDGGFPGVSKVTTVCAGVTNVNNAAEATQTVNVNKEDNNKKCSCKADHVTGCYHKTSEFTLDIQYTSTVAVYKANSESQELTVSADETVTFVCDVEGNPSPAVSVKGQRSGETVTLSNAHSGFYSQRSTGTKVMSCRDTDEYRCVADNGVGDGVARTVSVFVEYSAMDEDDDDSSLQTGIGIGLAVGLVLCVVCFFVGVKIQKMRSFKEIEKARTQMTSQQSEHPQQQQHHHHQQQQQIEIEQQEDGLHYQEITVANYERLNVNDISQASGRHRDKSQGYLYVIPKNTPRQQHEDEASSHNQRMQLDDNNTVYANNTHQKHPHRYLNVTVSPQGIDNPAHEDNSTPTTHPEIYQGMSSDQPYNGDSDGLYVEAD